MRHVVAIFCSLSLACMASRAHADLPINTEMQSMEGVKTRFRSEILNITQEFLLTRNSEVKIALSFHPNGQKLLKSIPPTELSSIPIEDLVPLVEMIKLHIGNSSQIPYAAQKNLQELLIERLHLEKLAAQHKIVFLSQADMLPSIIATAEVQPEAQHEAQLEVQPGAPTEATSKSSKLPSSVPTEPQPILSIWQGLWRPVLTLSLQTMPAFVIVFILFAIPFGCFWVVRDTIKAISRSRLNKRNRQILKISQLITKRCLVAQDISFLELRLRLGQTPIFSTIIEEKSRQITQTNWDTSLIFWLGLADPEHLKTSKDNVLLASRLSQALQDISNFSSEELHRFHKKCLQDLSQLLHEQDDARTWIQRLTEVKKKKTPLRKVIPNEYIAISALYGKPKETDKLLRLFKVDRRSEILNHLERYRTKQSNVLHGQWQTTCTQLELLSELYTDNPSSQTRAKPFLHALTKREPIPTLEL